MPKDGVFSFNAAINNTALLFIDDPSSFTQEFCSEDVLYMVLVKPFVSIADGSTP